MTPDPFSVFCLYYLGLTPEGEVRFHNANQVARRYNWTAETLLTFLQEHGMHPDRVVNTDFPLSRYQVDLQIAAGNEPADIILGRAQRIFEEFSQTVGRKPRDWKKEIEAEREADRDAELERRIAAKNSR